jgi:hypothetical protein
LNTRLPLNLIVLALFMQLLSPVVVATGMSDHALWTRSCSGRWMKLPLHTGEPATHHTTDSLCHLCCDEPRSGPGLLAGSLQPASGLSCSDLFISNPSTDPQVLRCRRHQTRAPPVLQQQ